jgi:hypothetical protein
MKINAKTIATIAAVAIAVNVALGRFGGGLVPKAG